MSVSEAPETMTGTCPRENADNGGGSGMSGSDAPETESPLDFSYALKSPPGDEADAAGTGRGREREAGAWA